jgi:dUTP pyrophosphatase
MIEKIVIPIKIFNSSDLSLPIYAHEGDSGVDLYATHDYHISPMCRALIGTGLYVEIPEDYEIQIRSRSGLAIKEGIFVLNSPGTIDCNFRNEIKIILSNFSNQVYTIKKGDRIAQAVLCPVYKIKWDKVNSLNELNKTERNLGGFGSTGK